MKVVSGALCAMILTVGFFVPVLRSQTQTGKLDPVLQQRVGQLFGESRIVISAVNAQALTALTPLILQVGGTLGPLLPLINARAATVPNVALAALANSASVSHLAFDRPLLRSMGRTGPATGATFVRQSLGVTGAGIGVAIIDTGVMAWHDDLTQPIGGSARIAGFVDFVGGHGAPYDDHGHGTHIAGIIAGSGLDSGGQRIGIAPGAHLLVLKVLDANGQGRLSNLIAALDYVATHRTELNLRVVNLSIATSVSESVDSDPLARATKALVEQGVVVVAAAGNRGRSSQGRNQYGGVTAPGNAPWVLTVGASSHQGTTERSDDKVAQFSSRGPTGIDRLAKPDILAPGVGIESLSVPDSSLYTSRSGFLLNGSVQTPFRPYLALSGTSQAAPVVAGAVALMLEVNPALTPNAVKAILQYTSELRYEHDNITQGAGLLNARGAVELARYFASPTTVAEPAGDGWTRHLIWGNYRISALGGRLTPDANAWRTDVVWGATATPTGEHVAWGLMCGASCEGEPTWESWGITCVDSSCSSLRYGGGPSRNIVWGSSCGGSNCPQNHTWTASESETVVWGTQESETVVWGTESETVVWGTQDSETVVWGTNCHDPDCSTMWQSENP